MLNPKLGDTMIRVVPPLNGSPGFIQDGIVDRVTDETIELRVQADLVRRMRFRRSDGMDVQGTGSFVIPSKAWPASGFVAIGQQLRSATDEAAVESQALTRERMQPGAQYDWINRKEQPERLLYLGRNWLPSGYWHQFELAGKPGVLWCEMQDSELHQLKVVTMAELVLTSAERDAALWTDLDDGVLGALLRKKLVQLSTAAAQMDRTIATAAALLLCCNAAETNTSGLRMELDGVTQDGREFGDWVVQVTRKKRNEAVDVEQVIYALQRAERALQERADRLHVQRDYSAELPAEDAQRMREAVTLLTAMATYQPTEERT